MLPVFVGATIGTATGLTLERRLGVSKKKDTQTPSAKIPSPAPEPLPPAPTVQPTSARPLSGRASLQWNKLATSGNRVEQVLKRVIGNSEIAADPAIVPKARKELDDIREEQDIPHAKDPQLESMVELDTHVEKAKTSKDKAETLSTQGFDIAFQQGDLVVRRDQFHRHRFLTDNSNFKGSMFLANLKKLPLDATVTMKDLNPTINKLCTSAATDKDPTFCGQDSGIIVYVSPKSQPISTSMCDALSITEHWNSRDKEYELSRQLGWGYYIDQNKYKLGYDWIRQVKSEYIEELQSLLKQDDLPDTERDKINRAIDALRQKPTPILKKDLLTTEKAQSEIELQLNTLLNIDKEFPQFEKTELHATLSTMQKTAHVFAQHKDVLARGVVKKEISVWGVSKEELIEKHPLVSLPMKLNALQKDIQALYPEGLDFDVASLNPDTVSAFLDSHRETHFDRNVGTTATSHSTVTDVIKENAAFKSKTIEALKGLQEKLSTDFPRDPRAAKISEDCTKIIREISNMYTEIQFYTVDHLGDKNEITVAGFGLKEPLAREAMSDAYADKERDYNLKKAELEKTKKQAEALKAKLQEQQGQPETTKAETDQLKANLETCQANIAELQKKTDHFEGVKLTREMIEEAHKRNIPCFIHYGPS